MSEALYYKDIAENIQKGTYYKQAIDWYIETVIGDVIERSYLILFSAISIALMVYACVVMLGFTPIAKEIPVSIKLSDLSREYSQLVPLISKDYSIAQNQDPDSEIQAYLLQKYVAARETYDSSNNFNLLNRNILFVNEFSISALATAFENAIDTRNPDSPRIRFRTHTTRSITIQRDNLTVAKVDSLRKRFTLDGQQLHIYSANVTFSTQENGAKGLLKEEWRGRIDFLYSPVSYNKESGVFHKIEFRVMNYQILKVK